jgi:hypothetical protein
MTDKLKALALAATPGPWWIDSHGHCMVSMTAGRKTIFVTNSEAMGPAVRHADTGNLSHWRNDNDASYIAAASPDVVLALIAEVERLKAQEPVAYRWWHTQTEAWSFGDDSFLVGDPECQPLYLASGAAPKPNRKAFEAWAEPILGDNPTWKESADCELAWQAWNAAQKETDR